MVQYPNLLSPGRIGNMVLKNRIVMPAMATNLPSAFGEVTDDMIAYYVERARGGVALIIVEHANVDYSHGIAGFVQLRIDDDRFIPGLHRLVEAIHEVGSQVAIQINQCGGVGRASEFGEPGGPSAVVDSERKTKQLSIAEIEELIKKFGQAAKRAVRAGFDAVELHAAHRYLVAEFLSPSTNQRCDMYGGNQDNRARLLTSIIKEMRGQLDDNVPILVRITGDEFVEEGLHIPETQRIARLVEELGVAAIHVTAGGNSKDMSEARLAIIEPMSYEEGWKAYLAREIKAVVNIPVIAVGVIRRPEMGDQLIGQGVADFVAIGRGLMADPEWANKSKNGEGFRIRRCISCNDGCLGNRGWRGWPVRCTVNPTMGREREFGSEGKKVGKATQRKNVLVVGGGPAGMQAAVTLSKRGHKVSLYEKNAVLGGQVLMARRVPYKEKLGWVVEYLSQELEQLGVSVHCSREVNLEHIRKMNPSPDVVVVATGSQPLTPNLPGARHNAYTFHQVLQETADLSGESVIVIGGGAVGCETALFLAHRGKRVTVCEMFDTTAGFALDIEPISRWDLMRHLKKVGVELKAGAKVIEVNQGEVSVTDLSGKTNRLRARHVVLALGSIANDSLLLDLASLNIEVSAIGDCRKSGKLIHAIHDGFLIGHVL